MSTFTFTDIATTTSFANTGTFAGPRATFSTSSAAGPTALSASQSGIVVVSTAGSGTQEWTLPAAATAGLTFTFFCANAATEILVGVVTGDNCSIKASEGGASVVTSANFGVKNTAATNVVGDHITLVSDGVTTWYKVSQSGIWATR